MSIVGIPDAKERHIVDKEFAQRLERACDDHPLVPPKNHGRLGYISNAMRTITGQKVSWESVRKWSYGEARPRPKNMKVLARVLEVDEAWLSLGRNPEMQVDQRRLRDKALGGAADILLGFLQMDGATVTIPVGGDSRSSFVNAYAIIKGALYSFHATLNLDGGKGLRFVVPVRYEDCTTIAVVRTSGTNVDMFEIPHDVTREIGARRGGYIEVAVDKGSGGYSVNLGDEKFVLTTISSFSNRL
jgi:hypothetical protein